MNSVSEAALSAMGYPRYTHGLLNAMSDRTTLEIAESVQIAPLCLLRGDVVLESGVRLSTKCVLNGDVSVGRYTNLEPGCELVGAVEIGNYCAVARNTTFQQTNHDMNRPSIQRRLYQTVLDSEIAYTSKGTITVGSDVWFGTRCIVLSGVTIGHGAVVAAGSVVTSDVEPYAVVAGTPAERIGWRFPREVREALLETAWWEWDGDKIRAHLEFFETQIRSVDDVSPLEGSPERAPVPDS
ncbi:CatB-related O-acetyltransferase [Natrononativus amylolyticus]|uniref:CatB-related O-acetyltransferase n=1 Tax=Natrononativus amylolyticus TaxID=2963434 RepID=UPI0020CE42FE|nr:CatB-related O-acetyltransferase [Natrononativus amylolyticus]